MVRGRGIITHGRGARDHPRRSEVPGAQRFKLRLSASPPLRLSAENVLAIVFMEINEIAETDISAEEPESAELNHSKLRLASPPLRVLRG
jgi:hypothetical protein